MSKINSENKNALIVSYIIALVLLLIAFNNLIINNKKINSRYKESNIIIQQCLNLCHNQGYAYEKVDYNRKACYCDLTQSYMEIKSNESNM